MIKKFSELAIAEKFMFNPKTCPMVYMKVQTGYDGLQGFVSLLNGTLETFELDWDCDVFTGDANQLFDVPWLIQSQDKALNRTPFFWTCDICTVDDGYSPILPACVPVCRCGRLQTQGTEALVSDVLDLINEWWVNVLDKESLPPNIEWYAEWLYKLGEAVLHPNYPFTDVPIVLSNLNKDTFKTNQIDEQRGKRVNGRTGFDTMFDIARRAREERDAKTIAESLNTLPEEDVV